MIGLKKYFQSLREDFRQTLKLSTPIVLSQIGIVLINVTDNVMVGGLGKTPLAAVGIANSIYFLLSVVGIGLMSVIAPLVASAKSQNDKSLVASLFTHSLRVAIIGAFILTFILFFLTYNFHWFQQPPLVEAQAKEYLWLVSISTIPLIVFLGAKSFSEGLSLMRPPMYVMYWAVLLNIFFNWVFIYGKLDFPALGLQGAALSTLICRLLMMVAMIAYLLKSSKTQKYWQNFSFWKYDKLLTQKLLKLGLPSGMQYFFEIGAFTGAAVIIGWLGTEALAAHQIAISIASVTYLTAIGLSSAGAIRVGDAFGLQNPLKIHKAGTASLILVSCFMLITCALLLLFNDFWAGLYLDDSEEKVLYIGANLLIIAGFFQFSDGIQATCLGILRGIEDVNIPTIITLIAYWIIALPLGYYFAFYLDWNVYGIWIGLLLGLTVSAILLSARFYSLVGKMKKTDLEKLVGA